MGLVRFRIVRWLNARIEGQLVEGYHFRLLDEFVAERQDQEEWLFVHDAEVNDRRGDGLRSMLTSGT